MGVHRYVQYPIFIISVFESLQLCVNIDILLFKNTYNSKCEHRLLNLTIFLHLYIIVWCKLLWCKYVVNLFHKTCLIGNSCIGKLYYQHIQGLIRTWIFICLLWAVKPWSTRILRVVAVCFITFNCMYIDVQFKRFC